MDAWRSVDIMNLLITDNL